MKLNKSLIKKRATEIEKKDFIKYIKSLRIFHIKKTSKFFMSPSLIVLYALMLITGGILSFMNKGSTAFFAGVILATIGFILAIIVHAIRKHVAKSIFDKGQFLNIYQKWFSYFGIAPVDVKISKELLEYNHKSHIYKNMLVPRSSSMEHVYGNVSFINNDIKTTFYSIRWKQDKFASSIKKDQFYIIQEGNTANPTNFEFSIKRTSTVDVNVKEFLKSKEFNSAFTYSTNDEEKFKKIFTPSVQKQMISEFNVEGMKMNFMNNRLVITVVKKNFSKVNDIPFNITKYFKLIKQNNKTEKTLLANRMYSDLDTMSKLLGYAYIIPSTKWKNS